MFVAPRVSWVGLKYPTSIYHGLACMPQTWCRMAANSAAASASRGSSVTAYEGPMFFSGTRWRKRGKRMRKWWNLGENGGFLWSYTLGNWGFYLTLGWLNFMFLHQKSASARHPGPNRSRFQLFCDPALCPPFDGIFTGERFFRNAGPQEMWKRGPTVRPVVHQQALRWDNILHSLDVAVIVFQASVLVFWTGTLKIAAPGSHFCAISRQTVPKCTGQSIISMTSSEHCNFEKFSNQLSASEMVSRNFASGNAAIISSYISITGSSMAAS